MNPACHLQWGWLFGHLEEFDRRERRMLMFASITPDLDGICFWNKELFDRVHHTFGHNMFTGIVVGGVFAAIAGNKGKGRRFKWFILGYLTVTFQVFIDLITSPGYPIRFFWPVSGREYYLTEMLGVAASAVPAWNFALTYILQPLLMVFLWVVTVLIYMKHRRTFIEFISTKLDKFVTDFIVLPFKHRCDFEGCGNRAHYECADTGAVRCIEHCHINRDLTISCADYPPPSKAPG